MIRQEFVQPWHPLLVVDVAAAALPVDAKRLVDVKVAKFRGMDGTFFVFEVVVTGVIIIIHYKCTWNQMINKTLIISLMINDVKYISWCLF